MPFVPSTLAQLLMTGEIPAWIALARCVAQGFGRNTYAESRRGGVDGSLGPRSRSLANDTPKYKD